MAESPEDLKKTLSEVEQFLEGLGKEKLGKDAKKKREDILNKLKEKLQEKGSDEDSGDVYEQTQEEETYEDVNTLKGDRSQSVSSLTDAPYGDVDDTIPIIPAPNLLEPDFAAYMEKKRKEGPLKLSAWQRRWVVIKDNIMFYYEKHTDKKQRGAVRLEGYEIKKADDLESAPKVDRKKKDLYFQLVKTGQRVYQGSKKDQKSRGDEEILKFIALNQEDLKFMVHTIHKITPPTSKPQDMETDEVYEDATSARAEEENPYEQTDTKMQDPKTEEIIEEDVYDDTMSPEDVYDDTLSPKEAAAPKPVETKPEEENPDDDDVYEDTMSASQDQTPVLPPRPAETPHNKPTPGKRDLPPPPPDPVEDSPSNEQPPASRRELPPPPDNGSSSGDKPPVLPKRELPPPPSGDSPPPSPARRELPSPPSQNHAPPVLPKKQHVITVPPPENDLPNMYMALWDCSADTVQDLAFKRGDLIQVVSREYESFSWWIGFLDGKVGLVPKDYLMQAYEL
ncbi:PREDICTED: src kinase-associated phosphoprotein 2-like isoform X1 [Branchiostoma belcheri]|uniref:Src kinase-associated phosphoprotein 2-like isoform X1 n=1 Tax=Branchiostoma belcheri TaxID=7741 RepID=A0A6P4ZEA7_BRABE|nr:PREDICTED: src kinase-associated phosphoprotein 2-like isoform X1 [Branchiostoma belcheri]